jgi:hypothetical protein
MQTTLIGRSPAETRNSNKCTAGKPNRKTHLEDQGINGRIILTWMNTAKEEGLLHQVADGIMM